MEIIKIFFEKTFEKEINDKMMYYSYSFEYEKVMDYINKIINIPLSFFIEYIISNYNVFYLEASDVFQFSNLEDCTSNLCKVIKSFGDKGYTVLEIGKLLENDGILRKDGAYTKYGENQSKTGCQLGLLNNISNKFFLSCIGNVFNELSEDDKNKLLRRLMLRNKLVQRLLYKASKTGNANYNFETGFLSESTRLRRKSNVRMVIEYICSTNETDLTGLLCKIAF